MTAAIRDTRCAISSWLMTGVKSGIFALLVRIGRPAHQGFRVRGVRTMHVNQTARIPTVNVARVGDVAFVGISTETVAEIGLEIKAASPFKHTFIITHCNGSDGYLVSDEHYKEGGYEVWRTPYGLSSSEMVIRETLRMLYDL